MTKRVLVLQGGGALGAYQAGVYQGLAETDFKPDWIAGTSIGAINAALIAGNAPQDRVDRLTRFWDMVSSGLPFAVPFGETRALASGLATSWTALTGIGGFFRPRVPPAPFYPNGSPEALSFYDTAPLHDTLNALVDFDRINSKEIRLSLGAVDICSGKLRYFDNTLEKIGPEHVMASGALPPGFPPITIEGRHYWDGGVVSNTPLQYVLDQHVDHDLHICEVDLFNAEGPMPRNMGEVLEREKDIHYASRAENHGRAALEIADLRMAMRKFLDTLPDKYLHSSEAEMIKAFARKHEFTLMLLVYRSKPFEGLSKDAEFSRQTMREHWAAGRADLKRKLEEHKNAAGREKAELERKGQT
ncbi:MAG: patatin-like phospholipase family protein [Proteobacteria bacterium]|nr:patatin-like phospholipase family protein [Pseudomonadota bacterium]